MRDIGDRAVFVFVIVTVIVCDCVCVFVCVCVYLEKRAEFIFFNAELRGVTFECLCCFLSFIFC